MCWWSSWVTSVVNKDTGVSVVIEAVTSDSVVVIEDLEVTVMIVEKDTMEEEELVNIIPLGLL